MLRGVFKFISDKTSDILDTDEKIYVQKSRRSSDVRNSNVPCKASNTQSSESLLSSYQGVPSQNPRMENTAVKSTTSQSLHSLPFRARDKRGESNTSFAWREHTSSQIELQEYDSNWPKVYQEECNRIKNSFKKTNQPLVLDMEHVGSTSVEGMCAKPIIDILIICGNYVGNRGPRTIEETCAVLMKNGYQPRYCCDLTDFHSCTKWMQEDGIFVKKGYIIHLVSSLSSDWEKDIGFIACREYLRTHTDARISYNHCKKSIVFGGGYDLTIKEYESQKDVYVNNLVDKAIKWYREAIHCIHIGAFNKAEKLWSCCNAGENESNFCGDGSYSDKSGCYYSGLKKDSYHPGRFCSLEYNFINGWYTCCSQGRYSDGCVKVMLLENNDVLLRNCEEWDVNNVCRWVKSLSQINKDYSESFRRNSITGRILLTVVDDETLQELGVSSVLQRKLFREALNELRIKSSDTTKLSSLKNELKKEYYDDFQGDFTPLLPTDEMSETSLYENVSVCQLTNQSHPDIVNRIYNWVGLSPNRRKVDKIEYIFNPGRYRMFLGQLETIENRQMQPTFQPTLTVENSCEEREHVLERLDALCHQVSHNRKARIVRMWHGCRQNNLPNLLSDGFAALGTLDHGWYGKAIYFTSSAKYATRYCGDSGGCLIMCYILLLNPFPVISTDAPSAVSPDRFRFYGKGNYKNYQCHYIPVSPVSINDTWDYRPPPTGTDDAVYDELAVFQESNILPQIVLHLK